MGFSRLNAHVFKNLAKGDPYCKTCNVPETPMHYFLECPDYDAQRKQMLETITQTVEQTDASIGGLSPRAQADLLLRGSYSLNNDTNGKIFSTVQQFIVTSGRFIAAPASDSNSN